jgi:cell filamentation protein
VRAVWDDEKAKWWFSVLDIVAVLRGEDDYTKNKNCWKYLKTKLKKENNKLVSATSQLKQTAADGKKYQTDTFDYDSIIEYAKNFQANRHIVLLNGLVMAIKRSLRRANRRHILFSTVLCLIQSKNVS